VEKKLSMAANVAIIVVAVAIVIALAKNQLASKKQSAGPSPGSNPMMLVKKQFPVVEPWAAYPKTVVLALSVGCHFCTASAPFYKQLTSRAEAHRINVVALLPQSTTESSQYLHGLGVNIPQIQQVNFADIDVIGTPTLFLADDKGVVQEVWQGQLGVSQQNEVFSRLQ